jgi:hypothetical protein
LRVSQTNVAILLSDEALNALQIALPGLPDSPLVFLFVQEADELGLWVRVRREDGDHMLLVRWEFILTVDCPAGEVKTVGLKP